uniref:Uncharacterized protein n=1 Tax=Tetranychus urticae TaxID=32264 RepID=T1KSJ4_TETUR
MYYSLVNREIVKFPLFYLHIRQLFGLSWHQLHQAVNMYKSRPLNIIIISFDCNIFFQAFVKCLTLQVIDIKILSIQLELNKLASKLSLYHQHSHVVTKFYCCH